MKKLLVAAGVLFSFGLVLTGCQSGGTSASSTNETTAPSSSVAKGEVADELTLYVVRHGKTMLNTTDRVQGWSDAVLTLAGEEVVTAAGVGLKDVDFQAVYSISLLSISYKYFSTLMVLQMYGNLSLQLLHFVRQIVGFG